MNPLNNGDQAEAQQGHSSRENQPSEPPCVSMRLHIIRQVSTAACSCMAALKAALRHFENYLPDVRARLHPPVRFGCLR